MDKFSYIKFEFCVCCPNSDRGVQESCWRPQEAAEKAAKEKADKNAADKEAWLKHEAEKAAKDRADFNSIVSIRLEGT